MVVIRTAREAPVEAVFAEGCAALGLRSLKLALRRDAGWPDRLVVLPRGRTLWAEFKRPGSEGPRPLQEHRMALLTGLGHDVAWFDDAAAALAALRRRLG